MVLNHVGFTDECKAALNSDRSLDKLYEFVTHMQGYGDTNDLLYTYLSSRFIIPVGTGEEWKYKISIAISHILLTGSRIDGIMYPTVAMQGNADNVALKPASFSRCLAFAGVEFVEVVGKEGARFFYDVIDSSTGLDHQGCFIWTGGMTKAITRWELGEPETTSNH